MAYIDGTIEQGDRILEVNGEDLRHATQEQASLVLRVRSLLTSVEGIKQIQRCRDLTGKAPKMLISNAKSKITFAHFNLCRV